MTHARWFVSAILAAGITAGLFYFMQYLVSNGDELAEPVQVVRVVDATMPDIEIAIDVEIDPPEPIDDLIDEPETPTRRPIIGPGPGVPIIGGTEITGPEPNIAPSIVGTGDTNLVPLVAIAPEYPPRALQRGIEGWCLVSFTVDGLGNVIEDSIAVVDAEPPNVFDRSSIRAAARIKYQPKIVDGQGVEVPDIRYLFRYDLDD